MKGTNAYFDRIRSAVQSDMSRNGAGEFALSLIRQIRNDAQEVGVPERAKDILAEVAARTSRESLEAVDVGRPDWSDAYDRIQDVLLSR